VFTSSVSTPIWRANLSRREWAQLLKDAGLPPTTRLHDGRHTAGSLALRATGDPKAVQRLLGHASEAFFLREYAEDLPGSRKTVGEAMVDVLKGARSGTPLQRRP
jgi:integrase